MRDRKLKDLCWSEDVTLSSGQVVHLSMRMADAAQKGIIRTLVDIDLQSFFEATLPRAFAEIALTHGRVFLLEADGQTIGSCVCVRDWHTPADAAIVSFGLMPAWRGRGYGRQFLEWVIEALAGEAVSGISLVVGADNRTALSLYEDVGFVGVGEGVRDEVSGEAAQQLRLELATRGSRVLRTAGRMQAKA